MGTLFSDPRGGICVSNNKKESQTSISTRNKDNPKNGIFPFNAHPMKAGTDISLFKTCSEKSLRFPSCSMANAASDGSEYTNSQQQRHCRPLRPPSFTPGKKGGLVPLFRYIEASKGFARVAVSNCRKWYQHAEKPEEVNSF